MKTKNRSQLLATCILMSLGVAHAQTPSITSPSIERQPLSQALNTFAKHTGLQLIYVSNDAEGRVAKSVPTGLTADEALQRMLDGTGLAHEFINERTVRIYSVPARRRYQENDRQTSGDGKKSVAFRVASAEEQVADGDFGVRDRKDSEEARMTLRSELEEVTVTGTHIRGVKETAAPSIVLDREVIAQGGYATIESLMEDVPQNFGGVSADSAYSDGGRANSISRASSIDLRGLGAESTLTLLNGTRRAAGAIAGRLVDISTIPLSVVERVEVVSGGRSAIYGADAVAGVVNIVTRRDFSGSETQAYYGGSPRYAGGDRMQLSHIVGLDEERSGLVAAYDYQRDHALDLKKTGLLAERTLSGSMPTRMSIVPDMQRHSGFLSGRISLGERAELFADGLYSSKKHEGLSTHRYPGAITDGFDAEDVSSAQYSASIGSAIDLGTDWALRMTGTRSESLDDYTVDGRLDYGTDVYTWSTSVQQEASQMAVSAVVDGSLPRLGAIVPRLATGLEMRKEDLDSRAGASVVQLKRDVKSAFMELALPLVERGGPGMRALDLSLAGRYDDYSDFGSTFNPQAGFRWLVDDTFAVRGTYAKAFRAPALMDTRSSGYLDVSYRPDPINGGLTPVLLLGGAKPNLGPETATTWSAGFDVELPIEPRMRVSASYVEIEYEDRLAIPISSYTDRELVLERESQFTGLLRRDPTAQEVSEMLLASATGYVTNLTGVSFDPARQDLLSVFPDLVLFDNRNANIALESLRAVDLTADLERDVASGTFTASLSGTYTLDHTRRVTVASPEMSMLNELGKPADFRLQAKLGWRSGRYSAFAIVHHMDDYVNPLAATDPKISSWTTLNLVLRLDGSGGSNLWNGLSTALTFENLFDRRPPTLSDTTTYGLLYDPTNANPTGRYVSLRVVKKW